MSFSEARQWVTRYANILFFIGGFVFDSYALKRIDSVTDLLYQFVYLVLLACIVLLQEHEKRDLWHPAGWIAKIWHHNVEALHFMYGGLLSAYVIFYFKSSTFSRSVFFLLLVMVLLVANEMPQIRRYGSRMRLGLYSFCVVSYLNYLLPVIIGSMGKWIFALAVSLSVGICAALVDRVARLEVNVPRARWTFGWPPVVVFILVVVFYVNKWIPPVPLSMQYAGIYHHVDRQGNAYELTYVKWPWYQFWRSDDQPFLQRPGDQIYCFVRVFGPRRFRDQIYLHWSYSAPGSSRFSTSDRIPLGIYGGRGEGFRGYAAKSNYQPGRWRVDVETSDERILGEVVFEVRADASSEERQWASKAM